MKRYRPNGPRRQICPYCRVTISTNALARAAHERTDTHRTHKKYIDGVEEARRRLIEGVGHDRFEALSELSKRRRI